MKIDQCPNPSFDPLDEWFPGGWNRKRLEMHAKFGQNFGHRKVKNSSQSNPQPRDVGKEIPFFNINGMTKKHGK